MAGSGAASPGQAPVALATSRLFGRMKRSADGAGRGRHGRDPKEWEEHLADRFYSIDVSVGLQGAHVGALAHIGQLPPDFDAGCPSWYRRLALSRVVGRMAACLVRSAESWAGGQCGMSHVAWVSECSVN